MTPFDKICRLLEERSGHVLESAGRERLRDTVLRRIRELGQPSMEAYAELLESAGDSEEWQLLVSKMTIKESYLFRGPAQWAALADEALPALGQVLRESGGELVAWSAACARGEEAATLAMVLAESPHMAGCSWRIVATDVDRSALEVSREGFFRQRAVRNVPAVLAKRYLEPSGGGFRLASGLLDRIEYRWLNLVDTPWPFPTGGFHIVLLRNVLIYFGDENRRRVTREARRVLAQGGWLFVGPSASLWGTAEGLQAINLGQCFAYRHAESPATLRHLAHPAAAPTASGAPMPVEQDPQEAPAGPGPTTRGPTEVGGITDIVRILEEGDPEDALARVIHLLEFGGGRAELQTLAGLCHEKLGEAERAVERYRAAIYLEPGLFQVHWLLGRCLEREGWEDRARREYRAVLELADDSIAVTLPFAEALGLPGPKEVVRRAAEAVKRLGGEKLRE